MPATTTRGDVLPPLDSPRRNDTVPPPQRRANQQTELDRLTADYYRQVRELAETIRAILVNAANSVEQTYEATKGFTPQTAQQLLAPAKAYRQLVEKFNQLVTADQPPTLAQLADLESLLTNVGRGAKAKSKVRTLCEQGIRLIRRLGRRQRPSQDNSNTEAESRNRLFRDEQFPARQLPRQEQPAPASTPAAATAAA